ncbi:hypothetical protein BDV33DRAFT_177933 [Aspergillus novoparasiticus]|uniref:Uncharacterized protein n=1 Tax=Aspergillus novoparasiticus TaxID=986946 RepID=A0A5N6EHW0_9EURO|nr:hypothetical protein BDV33DRAFT_177933 [Aspergillus novoparasiticus]
MGPFKMSLHLFPIITPHIQTLGGLVLDNAVPSNVSRLWSTGSSIRSYSTCPLPGLPIITFTPSYRNTTMLRLPDSYSCRFV